MGLGFLFSEIVFFFSFSLPDTTTIWCCPGFYMFLFFLTRFASTINNPRKNETAKTLQIYFSVEKKRDMFFSPHIIAVCDVTKNIAHNIVQATDFAVNCIKHHSSITLQSCILPDPLDWSKNWRICCSFILKSIWVFKRRKWKMSKVLLLFVKT